MIDTCEGSVPCLDEITRMVRGPFSDDGRSVPIECVAGRQAMKGEKGIFILSPGGAFMFFHTCRELSTGLAHVCIGTVRAWDVVHLIPLLTEGPSPLLAFHEGTKV